MKFLSHLIIFAVLAGPALAGKHALIISNAQYTDLSDLRNTHADADAYAEVFSGFGYTVTRLKDGGLDDTGEAFDVFLAQLDPGDEVALVFSGHGWSDGQVNYLVPVDAPLQGSDRKLKRETLALKNGADGLLDEIEARNVGLTVAIIDACRDNPFKPPEGRRSAGISRGLAPIKARTGSFIVYSAGEGQQALDRLPSDPADQKLSVFTRSFVPYLKQGLHLEEAISRAQVDTAALAQSAGGHRQEPAYYDAALGLTCIAGDCVSGQTAQPVVDRSAEADKLLIAALGLPEDVQTIALRRIVEGFEGTVAAKAAESRLAALAIGTSEKQERQETVVAVPVVPDSTQYSPSYWETEVLKLSGVAYETTTAAFSPDGTKVVWASDNNTARVWDVASGRELVRLLGHTDKIRFVDYSPDGAHILTISLDETARIWDGSTGRERTRLSGYTGVVMSAAFSKDGGLIVTNSSDNLQRPWEAEIPRIWDAVSGSELVQLTGHPEWVFSTAFSPDGAQIVTTTPNNGARVWDVATGRELVGPLMHRNKVNNTTESPFRAIYSPDGEYIATRSSMESAVLWDAKSGQEIAILSGHKGQVQGLAFSRNSSKIVTSSMDHTARVWDAKSGRELAQLLGHEAHIWSVAFSPDGERIVTGSNDGTARVWDAINGRELARLTGHLGDIWHVAFSADGSRILTTDETGITRVWGGD